MANDNNDYILQLGVDAGPLNESLNTTIEKLNEVNKGAQSTTKIIDSAFGDSAQAAEDMNTQISNTTNAIANAGKAINSSFTEKPITDVNKAVDEFSENAKKASEEVKKVGKESKKSFGDSEKEINKSNKSGNAFVRTLKNVWSQAKASGTALLDMGKKAMSGTTIASKGVGILRNGIVSLGTTMKAMIASTGFLGLFLSLTAAIGYATKEMVDFDKAMTNLAAIAAVPRASLKSLELDIRQVAASSINTANAVANMAMELIKLGATPDGVRKLLRPVNDLSIAFQASADSVAVLLKGTLNAFQESETQAQRYADVMAMAANKTALGFDEIAESFTYIAASANAMGYSVEQTSAMIGVLVDNNVQASSAGRVLSTVFGTLAKQGKTLEGELSKVKNSTDQMATAASLFGAEGARMAVILANNQDKVASLTEEFENSAGSLEKLTKAQLESVSAGWDIMTSAFTEFVLSVENGTGRISIFIRGVLDVITEVFNGLAYLNKTAEELFDIETARHRANLETFVQDEIDSAEKVKEARLKASGQAYTEEMKLNDAKAKAQESIAYREELNQTKLTKLAHEKLDLESRGHKENNKRIIAINQAIEGLQKENSILKQIGATYEDLVAKRKEEPTGNVLSEEELRKLEMERRKSNENLIKFARDYEKSQIAVMADGIEKRKALINADYQYQIDTLKNQALRTKEEMDARDKLVLSLAEQQAQDLLKVESEFQKQKLMLQMDAQALVLNLQQESMQNELALMDLDHKQRKLKIEEIYKDDAATRAWLISELEKSTDREKEKIAQQWIEREIKGQEELSILTVEMIYQRGKKTVQAEHAKNLEILKIQKEFAQQYLDNLIDDGSIESEVRIAQAEKAVKDLEDAIVGKEKSGPAVTFWDILGIDLTLEEQAAVENALNEMYNGVKSITDGIIAQYDRQLAKKKEVIKSIDDDISKLEKDLDKEKELRENGFANNVEIMERELEEKKLQREEELRQMQELEEKKKAMQKAQFLFDSAIQAQNLITSSTNIYKSLSPMGPLGIGLAIATIATMMGAFAAQKVAAFNAINQQDVSQFRKGGLLEGNSHERGGVKYYSNDPKANIKELEGGEYIVNTKSTRRFLPLLEAMNTGVFSTKLKEELSFRHLLNSMGISLQSDNMQQTLKTANAINEFKVTVVNKGNSFNENTFNRMLSSLENIERHNAEQVQVWEENGKRYMKKGNKTTITNLRSDDESTGDL